MTSGNLGCPCFHPPEQKMQSYLLVPLFCLLRGGSPALFSGFKSKPCICKVLFIKYINLFLDLKVNLFLAAKQSFFFLNSYSIQNYFLNPWKSSLWRIFSKFVNTFFNRKQHCLAWLRCYQTKHNRIVIH